MVETSAVFALSNRLLFQQTLMVYHFNNTSSYGIYYTRLFIGLYLGVLWGVHVQIYCSFSFSSLFPFLIYFEDTLRPFSSLYHVVVNLFCYVMGQLKSKPIYSTKLI